MNTLLGTMFWYPVRTAIVGKKQYRAAQWFRETFYTERDRYRADYKNSNYKKKKKTWGLYAK